MNPFLIFALALLLITIPAHAQHHDHGHAAQSTNDVHNPDQTSASPLPELSPEAYAAAFPVLDPQAMQHPSRLNALLLFDHLEAWNNAHGSGQHWQAKGWLGGDIARMWLRSEGERNDGHLTQSSLDALYGYALSPWWDIVAGLRHDNGRNGTALTRAAIGLQGLAPYQFEVSATAYLGGSRKAELVLNAEYSLLFSNKLMMQPSLELRWAAADDLARGSARGLGKVHTGLRLRYDITRRFAPYVGVVHERQYARSARWQRANNKRVHELHWVVGIRFWF